MKIHSNSCIVWLNFLKYKFRTPFIWPDPWNPELQTKGGLKPVIKTIYKQQNIRLRILKTIRLFSTIIIHTRTVIFRPALYQLIKWFIGFLRKVFVFTEWLLFEIKNNLWRPAMMWRFSDNVDILHYIILDNFPIFFTPFRFQIHYNICKVLYYFTLL